MEEELDQEGEKGECIPAAAKRQLSYVSTRSAQLTRKHISLAVPPNLSCASVPAPTLPGISPLTTSTTLSFGVSLLTQLPVTYTI